MKGLLLTLLLLNLAYFGYTRLAGNAGEPAPATDSGAPVPRLALVGEAGPTPARCATVGPFATQLTAQRAATWLSAGHHGSRLHSADGPGPSSYWVAVTTKTLQDATKIGLRLRAAGVSDLVIMPPEVGATDAIVSLGIYSERDRAEHRVVDLRRYAVAPAIIEQPHTVTTWWLDVQTAAGEPPPDVNLLAKAGGEVGLLRMAQCPVAPAPAAASAPPTPTRGAAPAPATGAGPVAPPPLPAPSTPASVPAPAAAPGTSGSTAPATLPPPPSASLPKATAAKP